MQNKRPVPVRDALVLKVLELMLVLMLVSGSFSLSQFAKPVFANQHIAGCIPAEANLGKLQLVMFVHGYTSYPKVWDSMVSVVNRDTRLRIDGNYGRFDYSAVNTSWVDNPNIGPKLAQDIACMAESSREAGGSGKVIVIAHSMGGLAVRYAVKYDPSVANDLGLVITIATPNTGSNLANWGTMWIQLQCHFKTAFSPNREQAEADCESSSSAVLAMQRLVSAHVDQLPWLPDTVPVMAIGGDVYVNNTVINPSGPDTGGDTVVPLGGALAGENDKHDGGGHFAEYCDGWSPLPDGFSGAPCAHSALLNNPDVQNVVVRSIRQYLASQTSSQPVKPAPPTVVSQPPTVTPVPVQPITPPTTAPVQPPYQITPTVTSGATWTPVYSGGICTDWHSPAPHTGNITSCSDTSAGVVINLEQNSRHYPEMDLAPEQGLSNYQVQATADLLSNAQTYAQVGLIIDTPTGSNGGEVLLLDRNGNWQFVDANSMGYGVSFKQYAYGSIGTQGSSSTMKIVRQGSNFKLYINDQQLTFNGQSTISLNTGTGGFGVMVVEPQTGVDSGIIKVSNIGIQVPA